MNRLIFLDSISGIKYPEMLVEFYDQFIALSCLFTDQCDIIVKDSTDRSISFIVSFTDINNRDLSLSRIPSSLLIYGRLISILAEAISDTELQLILQ